MNRERSPRARMRRERVFPTLLISVVFLYALASSSCDDGGDPDGDPDGDIDGDPTDADHIAPADSDIDGDRHDSDVVVDWSQELEIVTWNIENFPLGPSSMAMATEILGQLDADIIAVQEIADGDAFFQLVSSLEGYEGMLTDDTSTFIRVGLIWRTGRIVVTDSETLFRHDTYAFPRPPLHAEIEVMNSSGEVTFDLNVVVVHLKAYVDADSQARREAACIALDTWISAAIGVGEDPDFVVIGDWNDELTDYGDYLIFDVFLDQPELYTFLTLELAQAGEFSYLAFNAFIDHILVTSDALGEYGQGTTEVLPLETIVDNYRSVSDHRPVRAIFELP